MLPPAAAPPPQPPQYSQGPSFYPPGGLPPKRELPPPPKASKDAPPPRREPPRASSYSESRRRDDRGSSRGSEIYRRAGRGSGSSSSRAGAAGGCESDKECKRRCSRIFDSARSRRECGKFSARAVEGLFAAYEIIKDPDRDELEVMIFEDFEDIMGIDLQPLDTAISRYSQSEARAFLSWMGNSPSAAGFMAVEDEDYGLFEDLLEKIDSDSNMSALKRQIDRSDSLVEIAIAADNDILLAYVHDFLVEEADSDDDDRPLFQKYCDLAAGWSASERRDLPEASFEFARLMDDLLRDYGTQPDQDEFDRRTDFYEDYCKAVAHCLKPRAERRSVRAGGGSNQDAEYTEDNPPVIQRPRGGDSNSDDNKLCYSGYNNPSTLPNTRCYYLQDAKCEASSAVKLCVKEGTGNGDWHCLDE